MWSDGDKLAMKEATRLKGHGRVAEGWLKGPTQIFSKARADGRMDGEGGRGGQVEGTG